MNKPKRPYPNLHSLFDSELIDYIEELEAYIEYVEKEAATGSFPVRKKKLPLEDWPKHWPKIPEPPPSRIINEEFNFHESIRKFKEFCKRWKS
jgi:hypothetical protein